MRLVGVELTRLRWRRAVMVLLLVCVLLPAVVWAGLAWNTRPVTDAELRQAQQQVEQNDAMMAGELERCVERPEEYGIRDSTDPRATCEEMLGIGDAEVDWFLTRPQLDVGEQRQGAGLAVITILAGLVMLLGTTFAGHDWNSGSMSNQLLFEPRRLRVWAAKGVAVVLVGLVTASVVLVGFWAAVAGLAASRDIETSGATWDLIRNSALRAVPLVALAGLAGYALTMFFRSTVATLGVMFAVTLGGNLLIVALLGAQAARWLLPTNVAAYLFNGYDYYVDVGGGDENCVPTDTGFVCSDAGMETLSLAGGATYLGLLLVASVALSLWSFRRRDVP